MTVMYEFHYDYMVPKYGGNLTLCYMDTNSLVYHIKTDDFYDDIGMTDDVPWQMMCQRDSIHQLLQSS